MKTVYMLCIVISFCFFFDSVSTLTCLSNACELPEVLAECKPPPKKCPRGFALKAAGLCRCCQKCKRIIYENADCSPESLIAGAISDEVVCADGLECFQNICQKRQ
ncbi:hypothetical protein WA026_007163 [Henosepilachna vigintioctopunctata]|uniref:IGFBP N-terminal domain-containing protein n=1 Tax=Henosepilachna vigintioctopunctata TaxID=420089 RepID=A0AAW1VBZ3_9CUCU